MTSLNDIKRTLVSGAFTNDELNEVADAIRFARSQLTQKNRRSLVIGTRVKFTSGKTGGDVTGTVEKVAIKFVTVRSANGLWRVPANMLSVA